MLQVLANVAIQMLVLDLCMSFAFTTIVIAALLDANEDQDLSINSSEASWLGKSIMRHKPLVQSECELLIRELSSFKYLLKIGEISGSDGGESEVD